MISHKPIILRLSANVKMPKGNTIDMVKKQNTDNCNFFFGERKDYYIEDTKVYTFPFQC